MDLAGGDLAIHDLGEELDVLDCELGPQTPASARAQLNPHVDATNAFDVRYAADERRRPHSPAALLDPALLVRRMALGVVPCHLLQLVRPAGAGGVVPVQ